MSDDKENVDAGSETSGEPAVETAVPAQADTTDATATDTPAPEAVSTDQPASADAGGAADETATEVPVDGSRTGFVEKGTAGGECICPDGRKGTVHKFDEGLVCIPNHDQG